MDSDIRLVAYLLSMLGIVLLLIYAVFQSRYGNIYRRHELKCTINNVYEFIFNFKVNEVTFFKKYDSKNVKTEPLKEFYKRILDPRKLTMLKGFLKDCTNNVKRTLQSEVEIMMPDDELLYLYFYEINESNNQDIIHIEAKEIIKKNNDAKNIGISVDTAFLRKYSNRGYMIYIRLFPCAKGVSQEKSALALKELKHIFVSFYNESNLRLKLNASSNEYNLALIDYTDATPDDYRVVVNELAQKIKFNFELNHLNNIMNFFIGVGRCDEYQEPYDLLSDLKNLTYFSNNSDKNNVEWFFRNKESTIEKTIEARKEIEIILSGKNSLKNNQISTYFSPIFDMESGKLFGYLSHSQTNNSSFKSLNEMFKYAEEFDLVEDVCLTLMKRIVNTYTSYPLKNSINRSYFSNAHLFLQLSPSDYEYLLDYVDEIHNIKKCNAVFIFSEKVLNDLVEKDINKSYLFLSKIKEKGFGLCFKIRDRALPWPNTFYEKFDYFMIDKNIHSDKDDAASSVNLKAIISKLEIFEKPFIASDVKNKNQYRILADKNVKIFSGDYFAKESTDIVIPNMIKIGKLKNHKL